MNREIPSSTLATLRGILVSSLSRENLGPHDLPVHEHTRHRPPRKVHFREGKETSGGVDGNDHLVRRANTFRRGRERCRCLFLHGGASRDRRHLSPTDFSRLSRVEHTRVLNVDGVISSTVFLRSSRNPTTCGGAVFLIVLLIIANIIHCESLQRKCCSKNCYSRIV